MLFRSLLDKKLKEIEGANDIGSVDPRELCLVPDLVMPSKFKLLKFEKYDGTKCPENHLATYCNKMAGHAHNEDLLIHVFYDSLTGIAAQWYMERSSSGIFGAIQIHAGDSPRSNDPPMHEKETRRRLQIVCCQMEECGINGPTIPH